MFRIEKTENIAVMVLKRGSFIYYENAKPHMQALVLGTKGGSMSSSEGFLRYISKNLTSDIVPFTQKVSKKFRAKYEQFKLEHKDDLKLFDCLNETEREEEKKQEKIRACVEAYINE